MRPDFSTVIEELAHGEINRQASEQLAEVVERVRETGKAGRVTLVLSVYKEGPMCVLDAEIKSVKPQVGAPSTMFFFGPDGEILRDDPRQLEIKSIYAPQPVTVIDPDKE